MINLYLVRHGQTTWNVQHKRQGRSDSPLTDMGREQAKSTGDALSDIHFDFAFSSPSTRAVDTAKIILSCSAKSKLLQVVEDQNLYEMGFGVWEGKTPEEMKIFDDINEKYFWENTQKYKCPHGGESFEELITRAESFISNINEKKYTDSNILAVSHTATIKAILLVLKKRELDKFWEGAFVYPASLAQVQFKSVSEYEIIKEGEVFYKL